jgi:hypothetical protein
MASAEDDVNVLAFDVWSNLVLVVIGSFLYPRIPMVLEESFHRS